MTTGEQKSTELQALEATPYVIRELLALCRRMETLTNCQASQIATLTDRLLALESAAKETTTDAPCSHRWRTTLHWMGPGRDQHPLVVICSHDCGALWFDGTLYQLVGAYQLPAERTG
jgi:hypothetical protein